MALRARCGTPALATGAAVHTPRLGLGQRASTVVDQRDCPRGPVAWCCEGQELTTDLVPVTCAFRQYTWFVPSSKKAQSTLRWPHFNRDEMQERLSYLDFKAPRWSKLIRGLPLWHATRLWLWHIKPQNVFLSRLLEVCKYSKF